jgi:hypothetical protein
MRSGWYLNFVGRADNSDATACNHDGLAFPRRRARSIQNADVLQRYDRCIHGDEWLHTRPELRLGHKSNCRGECDDP